MIVIVEGSFPCTELMRKLDDIKGKVDHNCTCAKEIWLDVPNDTNTYHRVRRWFVHDERVLWVGGMTGSARIAEQRHRYG